MMLMNDCDADCDDDYDVYDQLWSFSYYKALTNYESGTRLNPNESLIATAVKAAMNLYKLEKINFDIWEH